MTVLDAPALSTERARTDRRWSWCSGPYVALNHSFRLRIEPDDDFRRVMEPLVAPFRSFSSNEVSAVGTYDVITDETGPLPYTLQYDGTRLASGRRVHDLTGLLAWHINRSVIERSVGQHVLLHAAAAVRGGVTVILPADQESGKTTTVAGLLREGFDYVTDEAVAIDPSTGWVTPFPKTLSLDPGSWPLFPEAGPVRPVPWVRQWQVPVGSLGARFSRGPVPPPRVIVFPRYVAGATTTCSRVSPGTAVRELARTSFAFPEFAGRNLATLGSVAARATSARLTIGSLDGAIRAIEALVSETLLEEL